MLLGIYGASGFGREILAQARRQFGDQVDYCFIDDGLGSGRANGVEILDFDRFRAREDEKSVTLAIADGAIREKLATRLEQAGMETQDIVDPSVLIGDAVSIGAGGILCGYTQITANAQIGRFFHANIYSYVAHDCVIGDYVTFAPRVHCNGNVHIADHSYIGTGAILKQGTLDKPLTIGRGAIVGMGAVVTKSVPAGEVWVGNPARPLAR